MNVYCFGCGSDVTDDNRKRKLCPKSNHVLTCWMDCYKKVAGSSPTNALSSSSSSSSSWYMCRQCFSTYEKYIVLQLKIQKNIVHFLDKVNVPQSTIYNPPPSKRMRASSSVPVVLCPPSTSSSPDVRVGNNQTY